MPAEISDTLARLQEKYNPLHSHDGMEQIPTAVQIEMNVGKSTNAASEQIPEHELHPFSMSCRQLATSNHPAWMASTQVILLVEYLRKYPDHGFILYESDGEVGLKFKPGLNAADMKNGRVQIAINMLHLLQDAAGDIRTMSAQGIEIPQIHCQPKAANVVGPSTKLPNHGNSNHNISLLVKK